MDVEKTIHAILESQLRAEKRADRADERANRADERMDRAHERADRADERADRADERMDRAEKRANQAEKRADRAEKRADKFDRQLQATRNLVQKGMQIVVKSNAEFRSKINALIDSQNRTEAALRRTDEKFNRWLETLNRKNANGHKK